MKTNALTLHLVRIAARAIRRGGKAGNGDLDHAEAAAQAERLEQAGQIIAIFALMLTALIGLVGISIDLTFAWREELRIQRAADAAALAGVVYLPGDVTGAVNAAVAEAKKNGYIDGVQGTTIAATQGNGNVREMDVTVRTVSPTFFVRMFGIDKWTIGRSSKAVFILPVPMGSPDNYYGVFGDIKIRNNANTSDTTLTQTGPNSEALTARGLFGSVLTQGADVVNGDAYMPKDNGSGSNALQDTADYYDYAVEMPVGSSNGKVWIYDPAFCVSDVNNGYELGDSWFSGTDKVSTYFKLYDTMNTPYDINDDTLVGNSGTTFTNMNGADTLGHVTPGSGQVECRQYNSSGSAIAYSDFRKWHLKWWGMQTDASWPVLQGGHTYRVRVTTDPGDTSQDNTNARNQFSIFANSTGGSPRVYGIGAMQMYTPLKGGGTSTFYLAQIDPESGAGKTVEIRLYDPGDTNGLSATLQILQPTSSGWSAASLTWTSTVVASTHGTCPSGSGTSILTNNSSDSKPFNGCWLTIDVVLSGSYAAPQSGWWKISYAMGGSTSTYSTDETTWQVNIRGNPVHLIP